MISRPLFDYQEAAIADVIKRGRAILVAPTGSGKTRIAIEVMKRMGGNILVVCPAAVKGVWAEQLREWWPEARSFTWASPKLRKKDKPDNASIWIVSYEILSKIPERPWNMVVLEELHLLQNMGTRRTTAVKTLLGKRIGAVVLGLTATPITNKPSSFWSQLDALWPGKVGSYYGFCRAYCEITSNEWSTFVVGGLRDDRKESFRRVVSGLCHIIDPGDVQRAYASAFRVELHHVRRTNADAHTNLFLGPRAARVRTVIERWESLGKGAHIVLCRRRDTAKSIAEAIVGCEYVTGDLEPGAREAVIKRAIAEGRPVACTYQSVLEGVNYLVGFESAIYAEIPFTPGQALQSLGRFCRANGQCPVSIIVREGSPEEEYADRLRKRLVDATFVLGATETSGKLTEALAHEESTLERLGEILTNHEQEDSGY
jgi:superfamily II DNA or RNA helicase